ncbi:MAG: fibronectin type III domain-containing protein, partial [bacterium]
MQDPANLAATRTSSTSVHITWTKSPSQYVTRQEVSVCKFDSPSQCPVNVSLDDNISSYDATGVLTEGTYYVVKVTFHAEGAPSVWAACEKSSREYHLSSCQLTPWPAQVAVGQQVTLTTGLVGNVTCQVQYSRTNGTGQVTIAPETDNTHPYSTNVSGVAVGSATVMGKVIVGGAQICQGNTTVNVISNCTPSAPSTPNLVSPSNGATVTGPTVNLDWDPVSWGTKCPAPNSNKYTVFIKESDSYVVPDAGNATVIDRAAANDFYPFTGVAGKTYYWRVVADNGGSSTPSLTWSFTVPLGCTPSAPVAPTLSTPTNGATVTGPTVNLDWDPTSSWGVKCPVPNSNSYKLYVQESTTPITPTILVTSTGSGTTSYNNYAVTEGKTYYWR